MNDRNDAGHEDAIAGEPDAIDERADADDRHPLEKAADRLVAPVVGGATLAGVEPTPDDEPDDHPSPV